MRRAFRQGDILTGNIPTQLILFFLPVWFGTFFQQLYNTADTLIVGNCVGTQALAAVGATGALTQLLIGIFTGLCSGASVVVAQSFGARDTRRISLQVHTSIALAIAGGVLLMVLGIAGARAVLSWMNTPADVLDDAVLYLRIYFLGMVPQMLYNMGTSILRAVGDSKRPLYFLIIASIVNIVFDLVFVAGLGWGVAGASIATVLSQIASAVLTLRCLTGAPEMPWHLDWKQLRMEPAALADICRIGLPTAAQSALYSVSNIMIQSSINGFGTTAVAAWGVYGKIDFLFWMTVNSLGISVTTFAGQNFGAGLYDRVKKGTSICLGITAGITVCLSLAFYLAAEPLFRVFTPDEAVLQQGVEMLHVLAPMYITYICIEILSGTLRGCGDVTVPTVITCFLVCGLRLVWLLVIVPMHPAVWMVECSYPISWIPASLCFIGYYFAGGWLKRRIAAQQAAAQMS